MPRLDTVVGKSILGTPENMDSKDGTLAFSLDDTSVICTIPHGCASSRDPDRDANGSSSNGAQRIEVMSQSNTPPIQFEIVTENL